MSNYDKTEGYYPPWLTDEECGESYKQALVKAYNDFYEERNPQIKKKKLDSMNVLLMVVSDVIAYRYLVKHYSNLFYKLNITFEEYIDYKVQRMYVTIRDKKEKIEDILSYMYMSFMLSSSRLIYDYAEKIGRCKLVKEETPYFQIQRQKFFFIEKNNSKEHIVYNVDNLELDEDSVNIRSNMDRYSLSEYNRQLNRDNDSENSGIGLIKKYINNFDFKSQKAKNILLHIFDNWVSEYEDDFNDAKRKLDIKEESDFTFIDYINYLYQTNKLNIEYIDYIEIIKVLGNILKGE